MKDSTNERSTAYVENKNHINTEHIGSDMYISSNMVKILNESKDNLEAKNYIFPVGKENEKSISFVEVENEKSTSFVKVDIDYQNNITNNHEPFQVGGSSTFLKAQKNTELDEVENERQIDFIRSIETANVHNTSNNINKCNNAINKSEITLNQDLNINYILHDKTISDLDITPVQPSHKISMKPSVKNSEKQLTFNISEDNTNSFTKQGELNSPYNTLDSITPYNPQGEPPVDGKEDEDEINNIINSVGGRTNKNPVNINITDDCQEQNNLINESSSLEKTGQNSGVSNIEQTEPTSQFYRYENCEGIVEQKQLKNSGMSKSPAKKQDQKSITPRKNRDYNNKISKYIKPLVCITQSPIDPVPQDQQRVSDMSKLSFQTDINPIPIKKVKSKNSSYDNWQKSMEPIKSELVDDALFNEKFGNNFNSKDDNDQLERKEEIAVDMNHRVSNSKSGIQKVTEEKEVVINMPKIEEEDCTSERNINSEKILLYSTEQQTQAIDDEVSQVNQYQKDIFSQDNDMNSALSYGKTASFGQNNCGTHLSQASSPETDKLEPHCPEKLAIQFSFDSCRRYSGGLEILPPPIDLMDHIEKLVDKGTNIEELKKKLKPQLNILIDEHDYSRKNCRKKSSFFAKNQDLFDQNRHTIPILRSACSPRDRGVPLSYQKVKRDLTNTNTNASMAMFYIRFNHKLEYEVPIYQNDQLDLNYFGILLKNKKNPHKKVFPNHPSIFDLPCEAGNPQEFYIEQYGCDSQKKEEIESPSHARRYMTEDHKQNQDNINLYPNPSSYKNKNLDKMNTQNQFCIESLLKNRIETGNNNLQKATSTFDDFTKNYKSLKNYIKESFDRIRMSIDERERTFINKTSENYKQVKDQYLSAKESLFQELMIYKKSLEDLSNTELDSGRLENIITKIDELFTTKTNDVKVINQWHSSVEHSQKFEKIRQNIHQYELRICMNNFGTSQRFKKSPCFTEKIEKELPQNQDSDFSHRVKEDIKSDMSKEDFTNINYSLVKSGNDCGNLYSSGSPKMPKLSEIIGHCTKDNGSGKNINTQVSSIHKKTEDKNDLQNFEGDIIQKIKKLNYNSMINTKPPLEVKTINNKASIDSKTIGVNNTRVAEKICEEPNHNTSQFNMADNTPSNLVKNKEAKMFSNKQKLTIISGDMLKKNHKANNNLQNQNQQHQQKSLDCLISQAQHNILERSHYNPKSDIGLEGFLSDGFNKMKNVKQPLKTISKTTNTYFSLSSNKKNLLLSEPKENDQKSKQVLNTYLKKDHKLLGHSRNVSSKEPVQTITPNYIEKSCEDYNLKLRKQRKSFMDAENSHEKSFQKDTNAMSQKYINSFSHNPGSGNMGAEAELYRDKSINGIDGLNFNDLDKFFGKNGDPKKLGTFKSSNDNTDLIRSPRPEGYYKHCRDLSGAKPEGGYYMNIRDISGAKPEGYFKHYRDLSVAKSGDGRADFIGDRDLSYERNESKNRIKSSIMNLKGMVVNQNTKNSKDSFVNVYNEKFDMFDLRREQRKGLDGYKERARQLIATNSSINNKRILIGENRKTRSKGLINLKEYHF